MSASVESIHPSLEITWAASPKETVDQAHSRSSARLFCVIDWDGLVGQSGPRQTDTWTGMG